MLAYFLARVPGQDSLHIARGLDGDETPLGKSVADFAAVAHSVTLEAVNEEFHTLFMALGAENWCPTALFT